MSKITYVWRIGSKSIKSIPRIYQHSVYLPSNKSQRNLTQDLQSIYHSLLKARGDS